MNCKDDATMLNEAIDYFFDIKEKLFYRSLYSSN